MEISDAITDFIFFVRKKNFTFFFISLLGRLIFNSNNVPTNNLETLYVDIFIHNNLIYYQINTVEVRNSEDILLVIFCTKN